MTMNVNEYVNIDGDLAIFPLFNTIEELIESNADEKSEDII